MQELAKTIETTIEHGHEFQLRTAAGKWATHCVEHLDGELLNKGLRISASIAEFMNEFERLNSDSIGT